MNGVTRKVFVVMTLGIEHGWLLGVNDTLLRAKKRAEDHMSQHSFFGDDRVEIVECPVDASRDYPRFEQGKGGYKTWTKYKDKDWEPRL